MNKQVLRTMIILCWVFLALYAILKLVPQLADKFVIVVNNEKIVKAGQFIDEREWLGNIIYFFTTLLTYQFYLCACCHKWFLSIKLGLATRINRKRLFFFFEFGYLFLSIDELLSEPRQKRY